MKMQTLLAAVTVVLTFAAISACTSGSERTVDPKVAQVYMELEQKYKRQADIDGFALEYAVEPPKTILIRLHYRPGSEREAVALDVHSKAREFARSLAAGKYGIGDLSVRMETVQETASKR